MKNVVILPQVMEFIKAGHSHFIDGKLLNTGQKSVDIINPTTEEVLGQTKQGGESELNLAVQNSYDTFQKWKKTLPAIRQNTLFKFADLLEQHCEEVAQIEALCSGKNIKIARDEVIQSCSFIRYYAGWSTKISGETLTPSLPSLHGESYTSMTRREPIGVVGGIIPWNYPVMILIWKVAAALCCGCTIVVKPSENSPLSALLIARLAFEAGLPAGAFNVVNGSGSEIGQGLIHHILISKVSFTGSVPTGLNIGQEAIKSNLTRFTLELGGKNAAGFCEDMSPEEVIQGLIEGKMQHQGQICASIERAYIHASLIDEVIAKIPQYMKKIKIGSSLDEDNDFGPISNKEQYQKILSYFDKAKQEGDQIIYGATPLPGKGYFVPPTVILANKPDAILMEEETFGPIVTIMPFSSDDELIKLMNDTPYGLTASVWTKNLSRAIKLSSEVEAGTVWINMHLSLDPSTPFGGVKSSGIGREFGSAFIESYTELKSIIIRY